jgi:hypothetical protein
MNDIQSYLESPNILDIFFEISNEEEVKDKFFE